MRKHLGLLAFGLWGLIVGCSSADGEAGAAGAPYDDSWASGEFNAGGKADGLLDAAKPLVFDKKAEGYAGNNAITVFYIDLYAGDRFEVAMSVADGNLNPHLTLYSGVSTYVGSESWKRSDGPPVTLTKVYQAKSSGRHYVVGRAYQDQGAGKFTVMARCTGGPCAGEYPEEKLDNDQTATCIMKARLCAFDGMKIYAGNVGPARARSLFEGCLSQGQVDGVACTPACKESEPKELCEAIIGDIPFYADQSASCLKVLSDCMGECYGGNDSSYSEDFWTTPESVCWQAGFNGTCNTYARAHEACGGKLKEGSVGLCFDHCESTAGAWMDDLDTICSEECSSECPAEGPQCAAACAGDEVCVDYCCGG